MARIRPSHRIYQSQSQKGARRTINFSTPSVVNVHLPLRSGIRGSGMNAVTAERFALGNMMLARYIRIGQKATHQV